MNMLLAYLYSFMIKKSKYKRGWKQYIIYPFIWLYYRYEVAFMLDRYVTTPNELLDFKSVIMEYAAFLTVMARTISMDTDINSLIKYKDTTRIFLTYNNKDIVKSVSYIFRETQDFNIAIQITVTDETNVLLMEVKTEGGVNTFSFNSLIDSRLITIRDNAECIIRTDIAANLHYLLVENKY